MKAEADFDKCGGGKGAQCCKFITVGAEGFCCERDGPMHKLLEQKKGMSARRIPILPFPACQNEGRGA